METKSNPSGRSVGSARSAAESAATPQPATPTRPTSSGIGAAKTEVPRLPQSLYESPQRTREEQVPIGNRKYEMTLKLESKLGLFMTRVATANPELDIQLQADHYCRAIRAVIRHVLTQQHRIKKELSDDDFRERVVQLTDTLTKGVCMMTYLKLRSLNLTRPSVRSRFLRKPRVPADFIVPAPYAYAISQLGAVEVSSLPRRRTLFPVLSDDGATNYAYDSNPHWSQSQYAEAVEIAQNMGLAFDKVDLTVKVGSAWWLFNPIEAEGITSLTCILPEDNYTEAAAAVNALFMNDGAGGATNEIFSLASLDQSNYGSFIRTEGSEISFTAFYGMGGAVNERAWKSEE